MKRSVARVILLAAGIVLSACLDVTSVITVHKDGSAVIEETLLLKPGAKDSLPGMAQAEKRAKKLGSGVTVQSREPQKTSDGRARVKITYAVDDITNLEFVPFIEGEGLSRPCTFDLDDDELIVSLPPDNGGGKSKLARAQIEERIALLKPMLAGTHFVVQIKAPKGISSSDASHVKDDTVTLMDLQFDQIMQKPDVFARLVECIDDKNMSLTKASKILGSQEGVEIEDKQEISILLR